MSWTRHLYIHIPFCNHICAFCDFRRVATNDETMMETYVTMVIAELQQSSHFGQYTTVYLGGGTPNHLPNPLLEMLLLAIRPYLAKHYEWTIECNPELVTPEQIAIFQRVGLNRISLGVQSVNNAVLKSMRRYHTIEEAQQAINLIQQGGQFRLSLDFIYDLPNSTLADIDEALAFIAKNHIRHVSYYALEVKPGAILRKHQIDHEIEEEQMLHLQTGMAKIGFKRYEISNWALHQIDESRHNLAYWRSQPWKAIGYGAHGFEGGALYRYTGKILNWQMEREKIDQDEQVLMMGLRLLQGLDLRIKRNQHAWQRYKALIQDDVIQEGHFLRAKNPDLLDDLLLKII